jgi:hypothetical protein
LGQPGIVDRSAEVLLSNVSGMGKRKMKLVGSA